MTIMDFRNSTHLNDRSLYAMMEHAASGWSVGRIVLRVRYSRGADFSGTCIYEGQRVYINMGRHLVFPYAMLTNLGRVVPTGSGWRRPLYVMHMRNGYHLALFIFLHELYHLLIKRARRNVRQKEGMCDRFAARYLVDQYGLRVTTTDGRPVPRTEWDFQDLDAFVAASRTRARGRAARAPMKRTGQCKDSGLYSHNGSRCSTDGCHWRGVS